MAHHGIHWPGASARPGVSPLPGRHYAHLDFRPVPCRSGGQCDSFVFTTTHTKWVNLGLNFGSVMPDPHGLLLGDGKLIRHVRIAEVGDLDQPGVRELVRADTAEAERPEGKAWEAGDGCAKSGS